MRAQSKSVSREVYQISFDQLAIESLVPVSKPFQVVEGEQASSIFEVNGVNVNETHRKRIIYVKIFPREKKKC